MISGFRGLSLHLVEYEVLFKKLDTENSMKHTYLGKYLSESFKWKNNHTRFNKKIYIPHLS